MPELSEGPITALLERVAAGAPDAEERLAEAVIGRLERIAARTMREHNEGRLAGLTLEPRILAHDALLDLLAAPVDFRNRRHLFAYASQVIVRAMIDYQRTRKAQRRGGDRLRVTLSGIAGDVDVERLPPVLEELVRLDPRQAEIVQLRVFWGGSMAQIAELLGVSKSTVERDWRFARHWLAVRLRPGVASTGGEASE